MFWKKKNPELVVRGVRWYCFRCHGIIAVTPFLDQRHKKKCSSTGFASQFEPPFFDNVIIQ